MNHKELDILLRRERLRERIRLQRNELTQQAAPLASALALGDHIAGAVRHVRDHPVYLAGGVLLALLWRPRTIMKSIKRGFIVWRSWRIARRYVIDTLASHVVTKPLQPYDRNL